MDVRTILLILAVGFYAAGMAIFNWPLSSREIWLGGLFVLIAIIFAFYGAFGDGRLYLLKDKDYLVWPIMTALGLTGTFLITPEFIYRSWSWYIIGIVSILVSCYGGVAWIYVTKNHKGWD